MKPTSFYMSLRTQYQNLGDFMIAWAVVSVLLRMGRVVLDTRGVPEAYVRLFADLPGVEYTRHGFFRQLCRGGRWVYVVKPGGYAAVPGLKANLIRVLKWAYFRLARLCGARLLMMPHSYAGALDSPRLLKRLYFDAFDLVLGRDHSTCDGYRHLGLRNSRYSPDMAAVLLERDSPFRCPQLLPRDGIAVSLRFDRMPAAERVVAGLQEAAGPVRMVSQVEFDHELNRRIGERLQASETVSYDRSPASLRAIAAAYARSRVVVSNRLHALLLGYINGAVPLAIVDPVKDAKIVGCLQALGLGDYILENDDALRAMLAREFPASAETGEALATRLVADITMALGD